MRFRASQGVKNVGYLLGLATNMVNQFLTASWYLSTIAFRVTSMRIVAKRTFAMRHPISDTAVVCEDALLRDASGRFFLYLADQGGPDQVLRLDARAALSWLSAPPEDFCIERRERLAPPVQ